MSGLRGTLGAPVYGEFVAAVDAAKGYVDDARFAVDPVVARRAIADAVAMLGHADTRLAAHAGPPS